MRKLTIGLLSSAAMVAAVAGAPAVQAAEVNLLTWEGYADESFIKPFEEATGCEVSATYVGSNDDFAPKLAAGGGVYDLVSPSIDATKALIEAGFIDSVDLSRLPRYGEIYEKFRTAEGVNHDGEVYGVPFSWGSIPFMYRTDKFDSPPTSLNILWDPALEGKISLWDDKSALYVASRVIGNKDIYNLSDEQIESAKRKLIEQKPLVRKYWGTAGTSSLPRSAMRRANWSTFMPPAKFGSPTPGAAISRPCWRSRIFRSRSSSPKRAPRAGWIPG